ncbi:3-dehydroquinate synthase family protein [Streptomyces afghaniensis]|uniref:3-dehydroquinate synthase family protein n=1 Tax=Streptomyces afghaniensis TaxID=66865 RepID=UPI0037A1337A
MSLGHGTLDLREDPDGTLSVQVTRQDTYPVNIGPGELDTLPALTEQLGLADSLFVITDTNVADVLLQRTVDLFRDRGMRVQPIVVPAGEASKSWPVLQSVIDALLTRGVQRRSALVALGGGVIVDAVGFVASVVMRGLPYINVPTSLVAQLDAAIGGKTGIDYNGSKNLLGGFYHPAAVLIDPELLRTLPAREIRGGLAEAVKVGILHPPLFTKLENLSSGSPPDIEALAAVTSDAARYKMHLLKDDPFERSLVRLLNLGHSFGHALEAATRFEVYRHGEAIAVGIALATMMSRHRGMCAAETTDRILACLRRCGLGVTMPPSLMTATWEEIDVIRRIRNGVLNEVLPVSVGECVVVDEVSHDEFVSAAGALAGPGTAAAPRATAGRQ